MKHLRAFLSAFDSSDLPVFVFILGLVLLAYGASQFHDGLGAVVIGVLLIIYVKPLGRWLK